MSAARVNSSVVHTTTILSIFSATFGNTMHNIQSAFWSFNNKQNRNIALYNKIEHSLAYTLKLVFHIVLYSYFDSLHSQQ